MADNTYKQVFMTYPVQQEDGNFYTVGFFPVSMKIDYPMTDQPIPDDLKGKVVKYNGVLGKWEDSGVDPNTAEIIQLKAVNATLTMQLAAATIAAKSANQAAQSANKAIAQLTMKLAADSAASNNTIEEK